ncbi:glycosyltransferase [Xylocopilactobacillus apis]|uniref:Glycosyl transferase family 2 n=1 Tax=Xylocopilactobacillus apis TaxID=2932183 RepID=A0AAU9CRD2_9LACO|nr:glycosyltransferase [Xylocopilactobacillus apis]BDR56482.1 glycosyl transferase family 2 [Xylocopilactobacillus apis]
MENSNKEQNFVSLVAYVHNNKNLIKDFYEEMNGFLKSKFLNYEIIFVDDASTDGSIDELKSVVSTENGGSLSIITMSYFQGKEKSLNAGSDLALGDFVYEFDSVFINYKIDVLWQMYEAALGNNDIVVASEKNSERFMSKMFYFVFNHFANIQYEIGTERMRLVSRRAINRVKMLNEYSMYSKATYANSGLNRKTISYEATIHVNKKKLSRNQNRFSHALNNLILFTNFFYRFSLFLSILMLLLTIFAVIYTLVLYLSGNAVTGWSTTMLYISFGFFGIFLFFTIVIKYLDLLVRMNFSHQDYLVKDVDKFR